MRTDWWPAGRASVVAPLGDWHHVDGAQSKTVLACAIEIERWAFVDWIAAYAPEGKLLVWPEEANSSDLPQRFARLDRQGLEEALHQEFSPIIEPYSVEAQPQPVERALSRKKRLRI